MSSENEMVADEFRGMADAAAPGRGTYINENGTFLVEVTKAFGKSGFRGKSFIVEFKVLESSCPNDVPVGSTRSWTVKWDKIQNHADLKAFALAATQLESLATSKRQADITATYMVYAAAGPLVAGDAAIKAATLLGEGEAGFEGYKVRLDTEKTLTQLQKDFTRHRWSAAA